MKRKLLSTLLAVTLCISMSMSVCAEEVAGPETITVTETNEDTTEESEESVKDKSDSEDSADDATDKTADNATSKTSDNATDKTSDDATDKTADGATDKTLDDATDKTADDATDKTSENATGKSADGAITVISMEGEDDELTGGTTENGWDWDSTTKTLTINQCAGTYTKESQTPWYDTCHDNAEKIVIASSLDTQNFANYFTGYSKVTAVTFTDGTNNFTSIGENAFKDCSSLSSITFPTDRLVSIGENAFMNCTSLTSLSFPNSLQTIGKKAFFSCTGLTGVTWDTSGSVHNSLTINEMAFDGCTSLSSFPLPESRAITNIKEYAFSGCSSLTSITIPQGLLLGADVFGNSGLKKVTFAEGVTTVPGSSFNNANYLTTVELPSTVTSIGQYAFESTGITSIDLSHVTSIGEWAFAYCSNLKSATFSTALTSLGYASFTSTGLTEFTIPGTVTEIPANAFSQCESLTTVALSDGTTRICSGAFGSCTNIDKVVIPASCTDINSSAFLDYWYDTASKERIQKITGPGTYYSAASYIEIEPATGYAEAPSLNIGETLDFSFKTYNYSGKEQKAYVTPVWSSSDPEVLKITFNSSTGIATVTALKEGKSTVTASISTTDGLATESSEGVEVTVTSKVHGDSIKINTGNKTTLDPDDTAQYTYTFTPADATLQSEISWKSSNEAVATIDGSTGKITALTAGTTYITVTASDPSNENNDITDKVLLTVTDNYPLKSLKITGTYKMEVGGSITLGCKYTPESAAKKTTLTWTSSDPKVMTVDQTGKIEALSSGQAVITVKSATGISDSVTFDVSGDVASEHTLTFDPTGGICQVKNKTVINGEKYGELPTPIRTGYDFAGWYNSPTISEGATAITADTKVMILDDSQTNLYAQWTKNSETVPEVSFTDVPTNKYYTNAVTWAVQNKITSGTSSASFEPEGACTRAQVVTFLWRAYGEPEPSSMTSSFSDVQNSSAYYYKAVLWAVEKGITTGKGNGIFAPSATVTRGEFVTFLWRAQGKPSYTISNPFNDIAENSYYYAPVLWAYEKGITNGDGKGTFSPKSPCTRSQVVTFIWRAMH